MVSCRKNIEARAQKKHKNKEMAGAYLSIKVF
jgi:hypothetical protein